MASRTRLAAAAAGLTVSAVVAFAVTGSGPSGPSGGPLPGRTALPTSSKTPTLPAGCLPAPKPMPLPTWYPKDLPMPEGSYVSDVPPAGAGLRRVVFTAKVTLRDFVKHALTVWPRHGWKLGRGESEPGEAEDNFLKTRDRYGLFRAQSVYCDTSLTLVLLVLADPTASPPPTPSR